LSFAVVTPFPRGVHANQGISHSMVLLPKTTKKARHPYRAIRKPPSSVPKAGPILVPASIKAFARPRWFSEKYVARIRE
jgi:hypothetical protein